MIIDQLPTIANIQNSDELPIERGQTTYKTTVGGVIGAVSKIVADDYDNSSTYTVGDYCIYEGTLYVCNTDISTAEEWNATHWTATNVTDEIPTAYTSNPAMDGTASPGSSTAWAKGDHIHPTDTSRASAADFTALSNALFPSAASSDVGKALVVKTVSGGKVTEYELGDSGDVTADMLGIVIEGNSTPVGASVGQYVIVRGSTITGITDGLYTAAQAIPANTAIDATYLTAVSGGGLNDLIIESGINNNGKYTKFPDGTLICVCFRTFTLNFNSAWGALFETSSVSLGNWPYPFSSDPNIFIAPGGSYTTYAEGISDKGTSSIGKTYFWRPVQGSNTTFDIVILGIGRWK